MHPFSHPAPARPNRLLFALMLGLSLAACGGESSETLLQKAQQSLETGDRKTAVIQLKSAIQEDENNAEARFRLGKLQLEMGDFASAEKEFKRAREAGYDADTVNPLLAKALIGQGEFDRVLDELPEPEKGSPVEVPLLVVRATAQLGEGNKEEARSSLTQAQAAAPENAEVLLALARLAISDGKPDKAADYVDQALRADPKNRDAWLFKGDLLRVTAKPADAAKAYQAALEIDPDHDGARLALAGIAIADNRLADARREVDTILKASKNHLQARYTSALIDFREGKNEKARDQLANVLKSAPDYLPALLLAGSVEYALGNMQTAESHLSKAAKANPRNLYALRLLAASQLRQGRVDDAARTLSGVPDSVNDAGFHLVAGEIALAKKDFAKAASHFEKAAQINPDNAAIRTELGVARLAQGDARAMADLQAAADMEGSSSRADTVIILNQLRQQKFDAALASIVELEKKLGASPLTWNYRAAAHLGKNETAKARESFGKALKLDPKFFPAAANLAQLDLRENRPADARKRFEDVLKADPKHLNAMLALADLALHEKNEKAYVGWLEKAMKAHPQALQPKISMARHLLAKGDKNQALAMARDAVNAQPNNPLALDALAMTQVALGDTANAIGTYRKLVELADNPAIPLTRLAAVQASAQQAADARKSLQDALRAQPDLLEAQLMLGRLDIQGARYDDALKIAKQIQQQKPKSSAGPTLEGDIALARKQFDAALAAYERAHKLELAGALLIRQYQALEGLGRAEEGEKRLAAWLDSHPNDAGIRMALAERLLKRGQYKAAVGHYLQLNQSNPGNVVVLNNLAWALSEDKDPAQTRQPCHHGYGRLDTGAAGAVQTWNRATEASPVEGTRRRRNSLASGRRLRQERRPNTSEKRARTAAGERHCISPGAGGTRPAHAAERQDPVTSCPSYRIAPMTA